MCRLKELYFQILKYWALNPKKHKEFKKGIAEQVGVHSDVVDNIVMFYYGQLRKSLSNLDFPIIDVAGLGSFYLRKSKLNRAIKKNKDILGNLEKRTYTGFEKHINVKDKLKKFEETLVIVEQMEQDKKDFKAKKNATKETN